MVGNKQIFLFSSFLFVLSGCFSTPEIQKTSSDLERTYRYSIYGKLELVDSKYYFTEFSADFIKAEPWIDLETGLPTWDANVELCEGAYLKNDRLVDGPKCKTESDSLFREKSIDKLRTGLAGVLTFGASTFTPHKKISINEEKLSSAIQEAGGFSQFKGALGKYNELREILVMEKNKFEKLSKQSSFIKPRFEAQYSGATDYLNYYPIFSKYIRLYDIKISDNRLDKIRSMTVDGFLKEAKLATQELLLKYEKNATSLGVSCTSKIREEIFIINLKCPKTVLISNTEALIKFEAEVRFIVDDATPESLTFQSEIGTIYQNGDSLYFTNTTDNFLTIDSLSYYYGNKISTIDELNLSFPPHSNGKLVPMRRFGINRSENRFSSLTIEEAANTQVSYGFAIRFDIAGTNEKESNTFYATKDFSLLEYIQEQLDN